MDAVPERPAPTCFFERDPGLQLGRRALAECIGTMMLMLALTGAGLVAQSLSQAQLLLGLAVVAVATSGALVALIIAFGPVSGGHFNPVITGLQWLGGERPLGCTIAYVGAQIIGALAGSAIADVLLAAPLKSATDMGLTGIVSEVVATAGLMVIVFGCARGERRESGPFAVGAWLMAAIVATPSTSYANPAIVIAALVASGPVHLSLSTVLYFLPAEIVGGLLAFLVISACYPRPSRSGSLPARTPTDSRGAAFHRNF